MTETRHNLRVTSEVLPKAEDVLALFRRLNWAKMDTRSATRFEEALRRSWPIVTAWDNDKLAGICRVVTDGEYTAYISELAVAPQYQGIGIGRELLQEALALLDGFDTIVLVTSMATREFWRKFGFEETNGAMMRRF